VRESDCRRLAEQFACHTHVAATDLKNDTRREAPATTTTPRERGVSRDRYPMALQRWRQRTDPRIGVKACTQRCMPTRRTNTERTRMQTAGKTTIGYRALDDDAVDFSNASLYLAAIQTIASVVACATTALVTCWLIPHSMVSAVRTLTITSIVGAVLMRTPITIGHVHGVNVVFGSLRPAVLIYIASLITETLMHTCTQEVTDSPTWRFVIFQIAVFGMIFSGAMRARNPLATTDAPVLLTLACLLTVAILPPPAVHIKGPLCQSVGLFEAAERVLVALVFAFVYSLFVYLSSHSTTQHNSTIVCTMRAGAASIWILNASLPLLPAALPQCAVAIWARLSVEDSDEVPLQLITHESLTEYNSVPSATPPNETYEHDTAIANERTDVHSEDIKSTVVTIREDHLAPLQATNAPTINMTQLVHFRPIANPFMTKERMAEIAKTIPD